MHEKYGLIPLMLGLAAALAVAGCATALGVKALGWLKTVSRRPRHRAGRTSAHAISVGGA